MNNTNNNELKLPRASSSYVENDERSDKSGHEKEQPTQVLDHCQNVDVNDESIVIEQRKNTEYIPSQIGNSVYTSGVNTVSKGLSGQISSCSSKNTQEMMDSKKYKEFKELYELSKRKTNECESSSPKRRKAKSESALSGEGETITESNENEKGDDDRNNENVTAESSVNYGNDNNRTTTKQVNATAEDYIPSEYGSFPKISCISTFTKSSVSTTEKIESKSTDTPNSKGGITHQDSKEK